MAMEFGPDPKDDDSYLDNPDDWLGDPCIDNPLDEQGEDGPVFRFTGGESGGMSQEEQNDRAAQQLMEDFLKGHSMTPMGLSPDRLEPFNAELEASEPRATQSFLPFRQVFDGTQETPPIADQKAAGALLVDYIEEHLKTVTDVPDALERSTKRLTKGDGPAEVDTMTRECDGMTIRVCVENRPSDILPNHTVRRIEVSEVRMSGGRSGSVVGDNSTVYHFNELQGGIAKREDIADMSGPPPEEPGEQAKPRSGVQNLVRTLDSTLDSWMDRENLGLQNQPVRLEELRALLDFLDRFFDRQK